MTGIIISIIVFLIVVGLVYWVLTMIPLPPPLKNIVTVILVVLAAIWLIGLLTGHASFSALG